VPPRRCIARIPSAVLDLLGSDRSRRRDDDSCSCRHRLSWVAPLLCVYGGHEYATTRKRGEQAAAELPPPNFRLTALCLTFALQHLASQHHSLPLNRLRRIDGKCRHPRYKKRPSARNESSIPILETIYHSVKQPGR